MSDSDKPTRWDMMFVSACPLSGSVVAYPPLAQERLTTAFTQGKRSVDLGTDCFNATVFIDVSGNHTQTTPAHGGKVAGHRTVRHIQVGEDVSVYLSNGRWVLHTDHTYTDHRVVSPPSMPTDVHWEWSLSTNLADARDVDWIPYSEDSTNYLEDGWKSAIRNECVQNVVISVGQCEKTIAIAPGMIFFKQRDLHTNNCRWVRRSCRTRDEIRAKMQTLYGRISTLGADVCAICTEAFVDRPEWPVKTTHCGHTFHACCLQACVLRVGTRCPLCRADFS